MTIERLGPVDPAHRYSQTEKTKAQKTSPQNDSVAFSDEARQKAELHRVGEQVRQASDVRFERVEEVRRRLADPNYIDRRVVEHVAEQIMDMFNL